MRLLAMAGMLDSSSERTPVPINSRVDGLLLTRPRGEIAELAKARQFRVGIAGGNESLRMQKAVIGISPAAERDVDELHPRAERGQRSRACRSLMYLRQTGDERIALTPHTLHAAEW